MPLILALVCLLAAGGAPVAGEPGRAASRYRPPTDGVVIDPFRAPPEPWLAGNRGIEYATNPGSSVTAIGPGRVSFAGPVAGRRIVTVTHPDGLRSSYVGLASIGVAVGEVVSGGDAVGLATDRLHLGVRRGAQYLDPATLWGALAGAGRVRLVPDRPGGLRRDPAVDRALGWPATASAARPWWR